MMLDNVFQSLSDVVKWKSSRAFEAFYGQRDSVDFFRLAAESACGGNVDCWACLK